MLDWLITHFCLVVCIATLIIVEGAEMGAVGADTGALSGKVVIAGTVEVLLLSELLVLLCLSVEFWGCPP